MSSAGGARGRQMTCKVLLLDDTMPTFQVSYKAHGNDLFDAVVKHLRLLEMDYFGLEFKDNTATLRWLDPDKYIVKQTGPRHDMTFRFSVKFYSPDPGLLEEEFTRYLFALQVKRDLASGSMPCNINTAALLSAYIAQAEIGDFNYEEFIDYTYLSSIRFVPNQSDEMEEKIMEHHKNLIGHTPADADFLLLDTARKVETYGVVLHPARDHEGVPLFLSVAHMGVLVYQNNTKINTFSWAKVRKLSFKRKRFLIKLHPEGYDYYKDTVDFFFDSRDDCKAFWKKCIEHHAFFRCANVKRVPRNKTRVFSRGSSFRYSGRTQKQLTDHVRENFVRRPGFERTTSVRVSSRSDGAKSNKSATLNSQSLSQQLNTSVSSGSHILENHPENQVQPHGSRVETVEVHSDSSQSGSTNVNEATAKTSGQSDERTVVDVHVLDEQPTSVDEVVSEVETHSTVALDQSANQNANDNDRQGGEPSDAGHLTVLHIDEDELMNRKNQSMNNNVENEIVVTNKSADSDVVSTDNEAVDISSKDEYDSNCPHETPNNNADDIQYILHRRPVSPIPGHMTTVVLGDQNHLSTSRPTVELSTFRSTSPSPATLSLDTNKDHGSGRSSPSGFSPMQLTPSPKSPRNQFNFVHVNKLPARDSFSSADDSVSPTMETEILSQFEKRVKEKNALNVEESRNFPKKEEEEEASRTDAPAERPMTFSSFRPPPPIITTEGPTPTSPMSPATEDFSTNVQEDASSDSSSSDSESESDEEIEETSFDDSGQTHVLTNPYLFNIQQNAQSDTVDAVPPPVAVCLVSSTPIKSYQPPPVPGSRHEQSTAVAMRAASAQAPSGGADLRPRSNIEDFFLLDGSSPIPFADDSPVPFAARKDDDDDDNDDFPPPPPEAYEVKVNVIASETAASTMTTFKPVEVAPLSPIKGDNEVFLNHSSASSELNTSNEQEQSEDMLEKLEQDRQNVQDSSSSSSESSGSEDNSEDEGQGQSPQDADPGMQSPDGYGQGFFCNPYAESHFTTETRQSSEAQYTFSSFGR